MKTVVLGLFDDLETARRVLNQLAASPLDLDQISVVHGDLDTQRSLAREAGLPAHRSPLAGTVAGALAGAALGGYAGATLVPESVGWLLAMALGAVLGAAAGAALGALSETVRVPKAHQAEVLTALEGGATALIVRSESLPTARAVGDLFRVAGSRELSPLGPVPAAVASGAGSDLATAADALVAAGGETVLDEGVVAEPLGESFAAPPGDDHTRFAPPPAEAGGAIDAPAAPTATDRLAGTGRPAASAAAPAAGETLYAPPWRRGVVDPADAAPAPTATAATPAAVPHPTPPTAAPTPPAATPTPPAATPGPSAAPPTASAPATPADPAASTDVAGAAGAAPVAGRAATHRLARLLLDAIDEVESGAPPAAPAKAARTPRKRATPSSP